MIEKKKNNKNQKYDKNDGDQLQLDAKQVAYLIKLSKNISNVHIFMSHSTFSFITLYVFLLVINALPYNFSIMFWVGKYNTELGLEISQDLCVTNHESIDTLFKCTSLIDIFNLECDQKERNSLVFYTFLGQTIGVLFCFILHLDKYNKTIWLLPKRILVVTSNIMSLCYFILFLNYDSIILINAVLISINCVYIIQISIINTFILDLTNNAFQTVGIIFLVKNMSGVYTILIELLNVSTQNYQYIVNSVLLTICSIIVVIYLTNPINKLYENSKFIELIKEIKVISNFNKTTDDVNSYLFECMPVELNVIQLLIDENITKIKDDDKVDLSFNKKYKNDSNTMNNNFDNSKRLINTKALYPFMQQSDKTENLINPRNLSSSSIDFSHFNIIKSEDNKGLNLLKRLYQSIIRLGLVTFQIIKNKSLRNILIVSFFYRMIYQTLFYWTQAVFSGALFTFFNLMLIYFTDFFSYLVIYIMIYKMNYFSKTKELGKIIKLNLILLFLVLFMILFHSGSHLTRLILFMLLRGLLSIFNLLFNMYVITLYTSYSDLQKNNSSLIKLLSRIFLVCSSSIIFDISYTFIYYESFLFVFALALTYALFN